MCRLKHAHDNSHKNSRVVVARYVDVSRQRVQHRHKNKVTETLAAEQPAASIQTGFLSLRRNASESGGEGLDRNPSRMNGRRGGDASRAGLGNERQHFHLPLAKAAVAPATGFNGGGGDGRAILADLYNRRSLSLF